MWRVAGGTCGLRSAGSDRRSFAARGSEDDRVSIVSVVVRDDAMIGTLVVTLPSAHTGGELIVEHGGESVACRSSKDSLSVVAFTPTAVTRSSR